MGIPYQCSSLNQKKKSKSHFSVLSGILISCYMTKIVVCIKNQRFCNKRVSDVGASGEWHAPIIPIHATFAFVDANVAPLDIGTPFHNFFLGPIIWTMLFDVWWESLCRSPALFMNVFFHFWVLLSWLWLAYSTWGVLVSLHGDGIRLHGNGCCR